MYFPAASRMAALFAFANPRLLSLCNSDTPGNSRKTISGDPSEEALSTTNISVDKLMQQDMIDVRQFLVSSNVFQLTIIIDRSHIAFFHKAEQDNLVLLLNLCKARVISIRKHSISLLAQ